MTSNRFPDLGTIFAALACFFIAAVLVAASWQKSPFTGVVMAILFVVAGVAILVNHKKF